MSAMQTSTVRADEPVVAEPVVQPVPAVTAPSPPHETAVEPQQDSYPVDRAIHAMLARFNGGISPVALSLAYLDWAAHLAIAPQRQIEIAQNAIRDAGQLAEAATRPDSKPWSVIKPQPQDKRFGRPEWEQPAFNLMAQAFLLGEQWWHNASTGVRGVSKQNEAIVEFSIRQMLDTMSPSNFAATNPEVLRKSFETGA